MSTISSFVVEDVAVDKKSLELFGRFWREVSAFTPSQVDALCSQHPEALGGVGYVNFFRTGWNCLRRVEVKGEGRLEWDEGVFDPIYITNSGGIPRFFAPQKK